MGFFKDAGLDVKITLLLNGPALTSAMASGAVDVAVASVGVVATAHEHNLPMRYIAPGAMYSGPPPTTTLVVAKDSPVKTGARSQQHDDRRQRPQRPHAVHDRSVAR